MRSASPQGDRPAAAADRGRRSRRLPSSRLVAYATLTGLVLFNLAVLFWLVIQALKTNNEFLGSPAWSLPSEWQWSNFVRAWEQAKISSYFLNSLLVSFGATFLSLLVAVPAAYALARFPGGRATSAVRALFFSGLLVSPVILVVPLYFEFVTLHLLDSLLGLALLYSGMSIPFSVWYLTSFFVALPRELEEAAATDGAGVIRSFVGIFLPNAMPGCTAVFVVNWLWAWNEFFFALTFLNSDAKYTIALGVFNLQVNSQYSANWVTLFAGVLITTVPVLVVYGLLSEQITRAMGQGAVKG